MRHLPVTRRDLARLAAVVPGAAVVTTWADRAAAAGGRAPATLGRVVRRGRPTASGWRRLRTGPGEPHLVRTDLGATAAAGRAGRRRGVVAFVQLSDVHVVDAQSPLRVEWVDRFDDPSPLPASGLFTSAYRPQEMLSAQVADAMVREINAVRRGPVTRLPLALAVQTGDNSDNSQFNEIRWNIDVLDGARVRPDSGADDRWEGVADDDAASYDRAYWHPGRPPAGQGPDAAKTTYGFPTIPGLLDAARRPFRAAGLAMPWYSAFGNHDGLIQGNFPASTLRLDGVATGPLKIISPPAGFSLATLANALRDGDLGALLSSVVLGPGVRMVTPDRDRRLLTRRQIVEEHFTTSGAPRGHGFTAENRREGTAYYTFDRGRVRFVVLDTVNPNGYADGSLDSAQFDWLTALLGRSKDRIVLVFSHHTSSTMTNPLVGTGADPETRVLGPAVTALLLATPSVVAWVNGHTHRNEITAHRRAGGGGFWEINTASHIDWPQQSRIIELADNDDGTLSIFTTMLDHAGPVAARGTGSLDSPVALAGLSRLLAANDWHNPTDAGLGAPRDRNTELVVPLPAALRRRRPRVVARPWRR